MRASGILLHPTSLPSPYGIGDLGPSAYAWVDRLAAMGQRYWQILPLTPTSIGDSPYFSPSAFAGNPLLISPDLMVQEGWLSADDLDAAQGFSEEQADYESVVPLKTELLRKAAQRFEQSPPAGSLEAAARFREQNSSWLPDYALFMALKEENRGLPWTDWDALVARRDPGALAEAKARLYPEIRRHELAQFLFYRQWCALKAYANERKVQIIGDVPIFVAHDSADVWVYPDLFQLDDRGLPLAVAGVPPDYFSETGQLWGNPLYDWQTMAQTGYSWWVERFRAILGLVDWIRLDHFRGFAAYWEVPAGEATAMNGRWVPGPGADFFRQVGKQLGKLPFIAEDLGVITEDVVALREEFGLPGMKILQFAFDTKEENNYFPHTFERNCVAYTGTHDNDTAMGWYEKASTEDRALFASYTMRDPIPEPHWVMIHLAMSSVADLAIIPLQDLLGLGSHARMNTPGTMGGNWQWRFRLETLSDDLSERFAAMTSLFDRGVPS